ncbi:Uncharacterised protein [Klebsiella variicola]|nr:Uncharacterised protein [Klebsiella variicola]
MPNAVPSKVPSASIGAKIPPGAPEEKADQRGHHAGNKDKQQQTDGEITGGGDGDQVKATAHRGGLHQPQQAADPADDPAHQYPFF